MVRKLVGICMVTALVFVVLMTNLAFAQDSISWKSDYNVGILDSEKNAWIPVKVTTFSIDALQLEWQKPEITKNQKITGYEILRKEMNSDYYKITEIMNTKKTSHIDMNLDDGYYGYRIIPILETVEFHKITMHGIDRHHNLFPTYVDGQQLLAQYLLKQNCIQCFDESFEEIDDTFEYKFSEKTKRAEKEHQFKIDSETLRTSKIFEILFNIRNNH